MRARDRQALTERLAAAPPPRSGTVPPLPRDRTPPAGRAHRGRAAGRTVVALASALVLVASGVAWRTVDGLADDLTTTGALELGESLSGETGAPSDGATDILLVGTDSRTDAQGNALSDEELAMVRTEDVGTTNTDTIILIRVPNDGGSATAISVPRDAYVDVPGIGMNKINGAYGTAAFEEQVRLVEDEGVDPATAQAQSAEVGRRTLVDTVQDLTGVTVDHYAEIGLLGFVLLTDAVDGVQVCLNAAVDEPKSGADLPAGVQTLTGSDALSFVRQREGLPRGDLDRIVRQQVFMASLASEVLSTGTLTDPSTLGRLTAAVERSVVIDSGWDVLGFATQLSGLAGGDVRFETIPTDGEGGLNEDGVYVIDVDPAAVRDFAAAAIGADAPEDEPAGGGTVEPSEVTVDVENGSGTTGLAAGVSTELTDAGFGTGEVGNADPAEESVVYGPVDDDAGAAAVAAELGGLATATDTDLPDGSVRVVLGSDYDGPVADGVVAASPRVLTDGGAGATVRPAQDPPTPDIDAGSGVACVN